MYSCVRSFLLGSQCLCRCSYSTMLTKPLGRQNRIRNESDDKVNVVSGDRQEGVALDGLPKGYSTEIICEKFKQLGIGVSPNEILQLRTRIGTSTGSVVVLTRRPFLKDYLSTFPSGTSATLLDRHDVTLLVEKSERLLSFSDDLRWLARPQHFNRIVTITEIPTTYGRLELRDVLQRYADVNIKPSDVVFQFDAFGHQTDMAWIVCQNPKDCSRVLHKIQELPVPQRVQYAGLFGCAFLWSHRSSIFLSNVKCDFLTHRRPTQVFLSGWSLETSMEDFKAALSQFSISPTLIRRIINPADHTVSFFVEFETVTEARNTLLKFHELKREWKMSEFEILFSYPRLVDIRWCGDSEHQDQNIESDSDIEDPIEA